MATLQLHLPEPLDAFVALQAAAAGYATASDYILALIQEALGHENLGTTMIYAHLSTKRQRADIARYLDGKEDV